jgi:hypothetical protein
MQRDLGQCSWHAPLNPKEDHMSTVSYKLKHLAIALPVAAAIGVGAPTIASADSIQPATTDCVIQGSGTPCTLEQTGSSAAQTAVAWAQSQIGSPGYEYLCLQFTNDAYHQAGVELTTLAGDSYSAQTFWDSYNGTKYAPSANPPAGALVFWSSGDDGHVAISEGNGMAVSTYERSYHGVHEMTIANRDSQVGGQLGYIIPG